ncbi:hypothetical protein PDJAM_G00163500 [Pangasius djambal]|uniref:Uncharacterized protein n=1 Tax=Pangasius djambal TaxID=1691987 RepID=A0ACC5ZKK4_9TELE|nr:hypothetical protein [Pangasius djambal]
MSHKNSGTKNNLYQSDGKAKVWRKKGSAHDPKHTSSWVKHGGGSVMAWAASGTDSLIFTDGSHDGSSRMKSDIYRNILSDNLQRNASNLIGRNFIMQQDNNPKHTATQQSTSSGEKLKHLIGKLNLLGLNTSLCNRILDFLTGRPQSVRIGSSISNTTTLSTGAPQGCVLSPLLFTLLTHDCVATHSSNHIIKFANDTTVVGLISKNDESAYREEVQRLTDWCRANNLSLNVDKTKEMVVDFTSLSLCEGFNVDVLNPERFAGNKEEFFGYRLLQYQSDKMKQIIVSAPLSANRSGAVFKCTVEKINCSHLYQPDLKAIRFFGMSMAVRTSPSATLTVSLTLYHFISLSL